MLPFSTRMKVPSANFTELVQLAGEFSRTLKKAQCAPLGEGYDWYPYDTMANIGHLTNLLKDRYSDFSLALQSGGLLDVGCADGQMSMFFASLGLDVTALDYPPTNYNRMRGVRELARRLGLNVQIVERDVDSQFLLPERESYGLVLALGILYHLKNPYFFLEKLAHQCRYCALSTRVAVQTRAGTNMAKEALAYLLDSRECNNDDTNYWIFSPAALRRLGNRAGWSVVSEIIVGCTEGSNPVDPDKDGRMFLFLRSRRRSIAAEIELLDGWEDPAGLHWAWTLKRFRIRAKVLDKVPVKDFSLVLHVNDQIVAKSPVAISCNINGIPSATTVFDREGSHIFAAKLPETVSGERVLDFEFSVQHDFKPVNDSRDLGLQVIFTGEIKGISKPIPFWLG